MSDYVALAMDDARPLGNTEDVFGERALHTIIGNDPSQPVPITGNITVTTGAPGFTSLSIPPTQVPVNSTSSVIFPVNHAATYRHICNNSADQIWIQFGAAAVIGQGIRLASGSIMTLAGVDLYLGAIQAISASSVNIDILEGTP